jgi:DNA adenine methylase
MVKPLVKWLGGKSHIVDTILDLFPHTISNYHEPFVGGGSVLLAFLQRVRAGQIKMTGTAYASDKNAALIAMYINIQQRPDDVVKPLQGMAALYDALPVTAEGNMACSKEQFYYRLREEYNQMSPKDKVSVLGTACFMFLNKTCFRGIHREGQGGFNVAYGRYRHAAIAHAAHVRAVSELLQGVVFATQGFVESLHNVESGDFVYMDPPYVPVKPSSFVGYTHEGFKKCQHTELFRMCQALSSNPTIRFVMSNADTRLVREAFPSDKYQIRIVRSRRRVNCKRGRCITHELLISPHSRRQRTGGGCEREYAPPSTQEPTPLAVFLALIRARILEIAHIDAVPLCPFSRRFA